VIDNNMVSIEKLRESGFALALSGGAALGCAHLGVMEFLEEYELVPNEIVGTSMGSIVGGAIACGITSKELSEFFNRFAKATNWIKFTWRQPSLLKSEKIQAVFAGLFSEKMLKDTMIPFKAVATDFETGQTEVFTREDDITISQALLCSMSIPVIFPPVHFKDRIFVDGYLSANLPVDYVDSNDIPIIAVDVMSVKSLESYNPKSSILGKVKSVYAASERAFYLSVINQTRKTLADIENVYYIAPPLAGYKVYQFHKWEELKAFGKEEAAKIITR